MDTPIVQDDGFRSRKFLITASTVVLTAGLAYFQVMSGDVALVFAAAISSYNWANSREKR